MDFQIKVDGLDQLQSNLERELRDIAEKAAADARQEYCAEHEQHADVRVVRHGSELSLEVDGCCDELVRRAATRLED